MISATRSTPSPTTTRSTTASAWSAGRVATIASAARVENPSTASAAGSSGAARSARARSGRSSIGRRAARRRQSSTSCRAMVNTQARNAGSLPSKRSRPRTTPSQVSEARSSAAARDTTAKYRSSRGCRSRQSRPKAASSPRAAAPSTAGNSGPIIAIPGNRRARREDLRSSPEQKPSPGGCRRHRQHPHDPAASSGLPPSGPMHPGSSEGTTIPLPRLHPAVTAPVTWPLFQEQGERRTKGGRRCCFAGWSQ